MLIRVFTIALFALFLNFQVFAQTISDNGVPVYDGPEPRMFLKTWLMSDPIDIEWIRNATGITENIPHDRDMLSRFAFKYDFLKTFGGEKKAQPAEGSRIVIADASAEWRLQKSEFDRINFDDFFRRQEYALVYAYAELNVKDATQMVLGIGSDDMCKIWLNGEKVYQYSNGRANNVDDDFVFVDLLEGKNTLLFKVLNEQMNWGFTCRFLSKEDVSDMKLFQMQIDNLPQESFNQLAIIIGGVALTTFLLLTLLLFLAKSNRKF